MHNRDVIICGEFAETAHARVRIWPPSIEPWTFHGKSLFVRAFCSKPDDPLYGLLKPYPFDYIMGPFITWKMPWLLATDAERVVGLWNRNKGLLAALQTEVPTGPEMPALLRKALAGKDRDILAGFGYPVSDGFARVLGKSVYDTWSEKLLRKMGRLYAAGGWRQKILHHLPQVTADALATIARPAGRVSAKQCLEAATSAPHSYTVSTALSLLDAYARDRTWTYGNLSAEQLHAAASRLDVAKQADTQFPPPPIPETNSIRYIQTARQLYDEGKRQHNCAYSMLSLIKDGLHAAYELRRPTCRCTILLIKQSSGWALSQFKMICNSPPSREATKEVLDWLYEAYPEIPIESLDLREETEPEWNEEDTQ